MNKVVQSQSVKWEVKIMKHRAHRSSFNLRSLRNLEGSFCGGGRRFSSGRAIDPTPAPVKPGVARTERGTEYEVGVARLAPVAIIRPTTPSAQGSLIRYFRPAHSLRPRR
jgi:hypothetical protein